MDTSAPQSSTVPVGQQTKQTTNATTTAPTSEPQKLASGCVCGLCFADECKPSTKDTSLTDGVTALADILYLMMTMSGTVSQSGLSTLEKAFDSVRQLDTYLDQDAEGLAYVNKIYENSRSALEKQMKIIETLVEEKRKAIFKQQEKDVVNRAKAVETLVQLVTQYNVDHPDANLDVTLSPSTLYQAYLLHQDQIKFRERVAKEKAQATETYTSVTTGTNLAKTSEKSQYTEGPLYTVVDTETKLSMKQQEHAAKYAQETYMTDTCVKETTTPSVPVQTSTETALPSVPVQTSTETVTPSAPVQTSTENLPSSSFAKKSGWW